VLARRVIYLHGFASGPQSKKGVAVAERLAARGVHVDRVDLRVPSFENLDFGAMLEATRAAIGGPDDRAVLIGSSLGGLTAARVAEQDPRVERMVLLAPAFRFGQRWRDRLGDDGWDRWMSSGWLETFDHTTGGTARVHADFARSVLARDAGLPVIQVPTLVLHGTNDDVVPVTVSRELAAASGLVRLVELPDNHELLATLPVILDAIEGFVLDGE
jgi:uncharacterized protein